MTRIINPVEYGKLSIVNAVIGILMTLFGLALQDYILRFYFDFDTAKKRRVFLGQIFSFLLFSSLFFSIALYCFGIIFAHSFFSEISFFPYFFIAILICFFHNFELIPDSIFRLHDKILLYLGISISKTASTILLSIFSIIFLEMGAEGPLTAQLFVSLVYGIFFFVYTIKHIDFSVSIQTISSALKFCLPIVFVLLASVALDSSDRLILQKFVDLSVVGYYSIGSTISAVLVMIGGSIDFAYTPFFYSTAKFETNPKNIFATAATFIFLFILFSASLPILFRREIIFLLAPPSYYPVIEIVPYLLLGAIFNSLFFIPIRGIYQENRTILLPLIIITGLLINIALNFLLIPSYNIFGAAYATIISSFIILSLTTYISQKLYFIPYQYKRFGKVILIFLAICFSYPILTFESILYSIILKAFFLIIFLPIAFYILQFFQPNEISGLKNILSSIKYKFQV